MTTVIKNRYTHKVIVESELALIETVKANKVNLCGADLRGADLRGADLRGADLYGADLCGADLRGADLRGAKIKVSQKETILKSLNLEFEE